MTLSMGLVVLDVLPVPVGLVLTVAVFVPYVAFLILRTVDDRSSSPARRV